MGSAISEGGGSQFRMPDQQTRSAPSTQQAPLNINVQVSTPAGNNATVTYGTLAQ
jgi:hypothetical protein